MPSSQSPSEDRAPLSIARYSNEAWSTAIFTDKVRVLRANGESVPVYPFMKLAGEAGEVSEKLAKIIRDKDGIISDDDAAALMLELGDVLWYVNACARLLGYTLSVVAWENIAKLASRQQRGTLQGSGDER